MPSEAGIADCRVSKCDRKTVPRSGTRNRKCSTAVCGQSVTWDHKCVLLSRPEMLPWHDSDSERQWHQLGHMQVCISLHTDNHASTLPLCFCRPDALLPPNQQRQSTEGNLATPSCKLYFKTQLCSAMPCTNRMYVSTIQNRNSLQTCRICELDFHYTTTLPFCPS